MKMIVSIAIWCFITLWANTVGANQWPSVIRVGPSVVCDTQDQTAEILDMYQSSGFDAANKILKRLMQEKNQFNDSKCVVTPGLYWIVEEKQRTVIQTENETLTAVILEAFDPRIREKVYIILIVDSKPAL